MPSSTADALFSALAFLATVGLEGLGGLILLWALLRHRPLLAGRVALGIGSLAVLYLAVLMGVGRASRPAVIPVGGEKYFCELDCHLAYRVTALHRVAATPGRWAVVIRTRFDEQTISARRSRTAPLRPNARLVRLRDQEARRYSPLVDTGTLAREAGWPDTPLTRELPPGAWYETTLFFDLPQDAVPSTLQLQEAGAVTPFLIGSERSPFHAATLLALPAPA